MKHLILSFLMGAVIVTATTAGAHVKGDLPVQIQPTITGSVASANEHAVTVNTDGGENMVFEVDSRSMVPTDLSAGTRVRIEFHLMESGKYHAARITPIRGGEMSESEGKMPAEHAENYGTPSQSEGTSASGTAYTPEASRTTSPASSGTGQEVRTEPYPAGSATTVETSGSSPAPTASEPSNESREEAAKPGDQELPQTSSSIPLLGILGLMALGAGLLLWLARRRRSA